MSPRTACLPYHRRKDIIKEYVSEENYDDIAKRCGCKKRTIIRDVNVMKATGEWLEYLERAMLRYGRKSTVSDTAKFNKYADLYSKHSITSKQQSKVEHSGKVGLDINALLKTYEELFTENPVPKDHPGEQVHPAHADSGTG